MLARIRTRLNHAAAGLDDATTRLSQAATSWAPFVEMAGIALEVEVETGSFKGRNPSGGRFREDLLFTHRGLSGPAILQISSYWTAGTPIVINLLPLTDATRGLLPFVAAGIAYRAVRNRGTVGGSLCHADPAGDWLPVLCALAAGFVTFGSFHRLIKIDDEVLATWVQILE